MGEPSPWELASHPVRKRGLKRHPSPPGLRAVIIPWFSGNVLNAQHNIRAARVIAATLLAAGSSPRARGTRSRRAPADASYRAIPACAGNTPTSQTTPTWHTGHPRVRGEHICAITVARSPVGSSPRARGTPARSRTPGCRARVIPACAGNTTLCCRISGPEIGSSPRARGTRPAMSIARPTSTGHPRVRGEHAGLGLGGGIVGGSSPRARGTPLVRGAGVEAGRVIPACAGNTHCRNCGRPAGTGHPRVRGEHAERWGSFNPEYGSSPRARGTLQDVLLSHFVERVIPACAGNTAENQRNQILLDGSSPRARGTRPSVSRARPSWRVIPACAGNTPARKSRVRASTGHPRVRGEHPLRRARPHRPRRVIPACAGNTRLTTRRPQPHPGHPRVRGEHGGFAPHARPARGSSPRARGTRGLRPPRPTGARVIPACAGNTLARREVLGLRAGHPRVRGEHNCNPTAGRAAIGSSPRARGTHV